ncbi:MAG TPA: polymer-forming cytoskeletal protein [Burkholderiales bacterium]|nr:polymer-forming cytoskeletal protein [Burkholderiales bacterium]
MFTGDTLFGKKEDLARKDSKTSVPGPAPAPAGPRPAQAEPARQDHTAAAAKSGDGKGSKLIVGPDIKLKGVEITDCDTLVVEGRVEAAMDSRVIQIAEHGVFQGTAGIDVAEIRGRFEGELTARKHLVIHAGGKVTGKIRYGKLAIEEGGELTGDISTLVPGDARRDQRPAVVAKPLTGMV